MKKSELVFSAILVPLDFIMLLGAGLASYFLRTSSWVIQYRPVLFSLNLSFNKYLILLLGVSILFLAIFTLVGLYRIRNIRSLLEDFLKIVVGISAGIMVLVFYIFLSREWFNSRFLILAGWFLAISLVFLGRLLVYRFQKYLRRKYHFGVPKVLIIGKDGISRKIMQSIENNPDLGYQLAAHLIEPDLKEIEAKKNDLGIDEIILADPNWPRQRIIELINFCEDNYLIFKFVPNLFQTLTANTSVETLGDVPVVELKRTALEGWGRINKRIIDFIGSLFGLILLSPFFVLIALIIKINSAGPVFVRLDRISQGKKFRVYKFRSMVKNAEELKKELLPYNERKDGPLFKMKNDPRITKVGHFLRKYRIDEFPQLINVLKGEMSLVGPRPHQPDEIEKYQQHHRKVLAIKAGMTGFAQASGSSDLPFEEEIKLDTYYVENWSLLLDLKIFLKTWLILFKDRSAC